MRLQKSMNILAETPVLLCQDSISNDIMAITADGHRLYMLEALQSG